ncbi:hypothetical protein IAI18_05985 [Acetobacteraceae bacterium H6797]|nr:hypothetical protein [Acetobacteraceae bacterium H6797]
MSQAPKRAPANAPHKRLSNAIAELHRALLTVQSSGHPAQSNPYALLQAVMHDPAFAWLKALTDLILRIDEAGAKGATPSPEAMKGFVAEAAAMVEGHDSAPEGFFPALRLHLLRPDVAGPYGRLRALVKELQAA